MAAGLLESADAGEDPLAGRLLVVELHEPVETVRRGQDLLHRLGVRDRVAEVHRGIGVAVDPHHERVHPVVDPQALLALLPRAGQEEPPREGPGVGSGGSRPTAGWPRSGAGPGPSSTRTRARARRASRPARRGGGPAGPGRAGQGEIPGGAPGGGRPLEPGPAARRGDQGPPVPLPGVPRLRRRAALSPPPRGRRPPRAPRPGAAGPDRRRGSRTRPPSRRAAGRTPSRWRLRVPPRPVAEPRARRTLEHQQVHLRGVPPRHGGPVRPAPAAVLPVQVPVPLQEEDLLPATPSAR